MNHNQEIIESIVSHNKKSLYNLIDKGASLKSDGRVYCPLLQLVAEDNYLPEDVEFFLEHGADVNERNADRFTPLMNVSYDNNLEVAKVLLEHGADINSKTKCNSTPLLNCVSSPLFDINYFIFLIEHGADVNHVDIDGEGILEYAKNNLTTSMYLDKFEDIINNNLSVEEIKDLFKDYSGDSKMNDNAALSSIVDDFETNFSLNNIDSINYEKYYDISFFEPQFSIMLENIEKYIYEENYISAVNQLRLLLGSIHIIGFYMLMPALEIAVKLENWKESKRLIYMLEKMFDFFSSNNPYIYRIKNNYNMYKKMIPKDI